MCLLFSFGPAGGVCGEALSIGGVGYNKQQPLGPLMLFDWWLETKVQKQELY